MRLARCLGAFVVLTAVACSSAAQDTSPMAVVRDADALPEDRMAALDDVLEAGQRDDVLTLIAERLTDDDELGDARQCLAFAGRLGRDAETLIPQIVKIAAEEDTAPGLGNALAAANALSRIAPEDAEVFDVLEQRVRDATDEDWFISMWAEPLGRFGLLAKPTLLEWFESDEGPTRMFAVRGMAHAGDWAQPYLLEALDDPEHWVSHTAVDALIKSGAHAEDLVPKLQAQLSSSVRGRNVAAIQALGRLGPAASVALPAIRARLEDADPHTTAIAAQAVFHISGEIDDETVDRVAAALDTTSIPTQSAAAAALRDFGPRAESAIPAIGKRMRRTSIGARETMCEALGAIGSKKGVPILIGRLRGEYDEDAEHYDDVVAYDDLEAAIDALVLLDAVEALPALREIADRDDDPTHWGAIRLTRRAREAIKTLER